MKRRHDTPDIESDTMDFIYSDRGNKQEEHSPLLELPWEMKDPQQEWQLQFARLLCVSSRGFAGRKRTSSGSFKEPSIDEDGKVPAQRLSIANDPYHSLELIQRDTARGHKMPLFDKSFNDIDFQARTQDQQALTHTNPSNSLDPERSAKSSDRPCKRKRCVSLLPWKDENRFEPEIR